MNNLPVSRAVKLSRKRVARMFLPQLPLPRRLTRPGKRPGGEAARGNVREIPLVAAQHRRFSEHTSEVEIPLRKIIAATQRW